jgi:hypothetical protein
MDLRNLIWIFFLLASLQPVVQGGLPMSGGTLITHGRRDRRRRPLCDRTVNPQLGQYPAGRARAVSPRAGDAAGRLRRYAARRRADGKTDGGR